MTLAAVFRLPDGIPFLLGDALTSHPSGTSTVNLPTGSGLKFKGLYKGVELPSGLKQKTILLSDHLAFGWSGNWLQSATLIQEVSEEFGTDEVRGPDVVSFLESKAADYPRTNLVGMSKF